MKIETRIIQAEDHEIVQSFKCGNSSIENFLKQEAYFLTISKECSTALAFLGDDLVGFFSLRKSTVDIETGEDITKIPCLDIAHIAVASEYQNQGIGSKLLVMIFDIAETVNEKYITLEALIEKYEWYKKRKFEALIEEEETRSNPNGLVYMFADLHKHELLEEYFDEMASSDWSVKLDFESDVPELDKGDLKKLDTIFENVVRK